jgi:hypothetical protein
MQTRSFRLHLGRRIAHRGGSLALIAAGAALAVSAPAAAAAATPPDGSGNFAYRTIDNHRDPTFNQLLGINNSGLIVGYFGSGAAGHPNKGYMLRSPHNQGDFSAENFPGSVQTQVTGLNDNGVSVGFWSRMDTASMHNANFGFYRFRGRYHTVLFPTRNNSKPPVNQLLGVNDHGVAVGFYSDSSNTNHGYTYNIFTHRFRIVRVPGESNVTAAAINNLGDIAGFGTDSAGVTVGYLLRSDGTTFSLAVPGASATQAFGVNDGDVVVGAYTVGSGSSAMSYGFEWAPGIGFETISDPNGIGSTVINGINDRGTIVGFYTDAAGNTDGMLAHPIG